MTNFPAYDPEADRFKTCKCEVCAKIVAEETAEHFTKVEGAGVDPFHVCPVCWAELLKGEATTLAEAWLRFKVAFVSHPAFGWLIDRVLFPLPEWLHDRFPDNSNRCPYCGDELHGSCYCRHPDAIQPCDEWGCIHLPNHHPDCPLSPTRKDV